MHIRLISLMILVAGGMDCGHWFSSKASGAGDSNTAHPEVTENPEAQTARGSKPQFFSTFFAKAGAISYNGYHVVRLNKTVHATKRGLDIPISYAVVKKNGKTLATFDGVYFRDGNATDFGLASLLGGKAKQLVVSQTISRSGRHWVVDLWSGARLLFDSFDYKLGREQVFLMDVDNDGVSELGLLLTAFWGFGSLSMSQHEVMPMIVFRYDPRSRKYLPANPRFGYELEGIEEEAKAVDPGEKPSGSFTGDYLGKRLSIFLRYVYAGRREQGWAFFERTYHLADANQIKAGIRRRLRKEPVYRFIYHLSKRPAHR